MGKNSKEYNKVRNERRRIKYANDSSYRASILEKQKNYNKLESSKERQKEYDQNRPKEKIKERTGRYYKENIERVKTRVKTYNTANKDKVSKNRIEYAKKNRVTINSRIREKRLELRKFIISHYGGKCDCCGETIFEFLSFDHRDGGGRKHRKGFSNAVAFFRWIINNDFPDTIRILCHNCNQSLGSYGYCPHNKTVKEPTNILPFGRLLTRG